MEPQLVKDALVISAVIRSVKESCAWKEIPEAVIQEFKTVLSKPEFHDIQTLLEATHVDYFCLPGHRGRYSDLFFERKQAELPELINEQVSYAIKILSNTENLPVTQYVPEWTSATDCRRENNIHTLITQQDLAIYLNEVLPLLMKYCFNQEFGCQYDLFNARVYCPISPFKSVNYDMSELAVAKQLLNEMVLRAAKYTEEFSTDVAFVNTQENSTAPTLIGNSRDILFKSPSASVSESTVDHNYSLTTKEKTTCTCTMI